MFKKLQDKWKVNGFNLFLIIATFAIGGSLCGFVGRKILGLTDLDKNGIWYVLYVLLITILWPICVILVSIPMGQFVFFKTYLRKVFNRLSGRKKTNS